MASPASVLLLALVLLICLTARATKQHEFKLVSAPRLEKFLQISFFVHDDLLVPDATAVFVVPPVTGIPKEYIWEGRAFFGGVVVLDDPITEGVGPDSKRIGQARGLYIWDSLEGGPAVEFIFTAVFNEDSGFTDGTTLVFRGYDYLADAVREIAVVGGTKDLRRASGWTQFSVAKAEGYTAVLNFTANVFLPVHGRIQD